MQANHHMTDEGTVIGRQEVSDEKLPHNTVQNEDAANIENGAKDETSDRAIGHQKSNSSIWDNDQIKAEAGRAKGSHNVTRAVVIFVGVHVLIVILIIPLLILVMSVMKFIESKGHDYVATFQVITTCIGFVSACFGALQIGITPQVSEASGIQDYGKVGDVFRAGVGLSVLCGVVGSVSVFCAREPLLRLFSREDEQDRVVELGLTLLTYMAFDIFPNQVRTAVSAIYQGLGFIPQMVFINLTGAPLIFIFMVPFYEKHGFEYAGIGQISNTIWAVVLLLWWLTGFKKRRELYGLCDWSWNIKPLTGVLSGLGWVTVRSVFNQLRMLVSVILVSRRGFVYGASYPFIQIRMVTAMAAGIAFAMFFLPIVASRLWRTPNKVVSLHLFSGYFKIGMTICVVVTALYARGGRKSLQKYLENSVDKIKDSGTEVVTRGVFVCFIAQCLLRGVNALFDGAAIAFRQEQMSGIACVISFVVFLPIALAGQDSFETILGAEVAYFFVRGCTLGWCLLKKVGWKPWTGFPEGVPIDAEWQSMVDDARKEACCQCCSCSGLAIFLGYALECLTNTVPQDGNTDKEPPQVGEPTKIEPESNIVPPALLVTPPHSPREPA